MNFIKIKNKDLQRRSPEEYLEAPKMPVCMMLEDIRSLHNVGAAFRIADAFGVERIYLTGITGRPPHRELNKTALGAQDTVPWEYFQHATDAVDSIKGLGFKIVAVEQAEPATQLDRIEVQVDQKHCIVFGNEVDGISQQLLDLTDACVEIPQVGTKHSLNVSVSIGVVFWEYFKAFQHRL